MKQKKIAVVFDRIPITHDPGASAAVQRPASEDTMAAKNWLTLFAFSCSAAANAVMFMDFVVLSELSANAFGVTPADIAATYSLGLFTTLPVAFLVVYFLPRRSYWVFFCGAFCNSLGAWLRWMALANGDWNLCLISTVSIGFGFAVCCMSFAVVGERWFPPEQQMLTTSIGVQSNYAGWCFGALLIPTLVKTAEDHERFMFVQAIATSFVVVFFFLFHNESVAKPQPEDIPSVGKSLGALCKNKIYWVRLGSYATVGAVSYTIPAVQDALLAETLDATPDFTKWTDTAFIATGVITGLVLSAREPKNPRMLIKVLFVGCAVSLGVAAWLVSPLAEGLAMAPRRGALSVAMAIAGGTSLGFLGIALAQITHDAPDVHEAYSAGAVEWFVQAGGSFLSYNAINAQGFVICAALVIAATLSLLSAECLAGETAANVGGSGKDSTKPPKDSRGTHPSTFV